MPIEVNAANIKALRDAVLPPLKELSEELDSRDVERFTNDDTYVGFFLEWNKDVESAVKMVIKALKWRKQFGVNDITEASLGEEVLKKGFFFVRGRAVDGSRVLHFKTAGVEKKDREINQKLAVFWFERVQRAEPGQKITILMDTSGARLMQADTTFTNFVIECCAVNFPGMMKKIIIYNLPTLLNSFWKLISKMLSQEQRDATVLCGKSEIQKYIDEDNLTEDMGGKIKFEYSYPPLPEITEK